MNLLTNIKERLGKVSNSLRNQNDRISESNGSSDFEYAGAELLMRYQSHWKVIHNKNVCCAKLATDCDQLIRTLQHKTQLNTESLEKLQSQCHTLPSLLDQVNATSEKLKQLSDQCEKVEESLTTLECLNIRVSYAERKRKQIQGYHTHELVKKAQLELKKKEQLDFTRKEEERRKIEVQRKVQERHEIFEIEHLEQMKLYKDTGVLPICDKTNINNCTKSLTDMHLNLENEELEEFLKDDEDGVLVYEDHGQDNNDNNANDYESDQSENEGVYQDHPINH